MRTMKELELRKAAICSVCNQKIGQAGLVFYRVRVERWLVDLGAAQRQTGLAMQLGGAAGLAMAMGPDEAMARETGGVTLVVCAHCDVDDAARLAEGKIESEGNAMARAR